MRLCSRKRPMIERTWILCETPGMPGRRQHMPRTTRSILTPAWLALYRARMTFGSVSELTLAMMCAGWPSAAWAASRLIISSRFFFRVNGACNSFFMRSVLPIPISWLNSLCRSSQSATSAVSRL
ncbi:Uncharacterised protein [Klebsiella pneumoniae]|nr:Uncharacterised protein [Klebsiella pneumoniae]